jgi:bacillolysin
MATLERFNFHSEEQPEVEIEGAPSGLAAAAAEAAPAGFGASGAAAGAGEIPVTDEAAARHFLDQVLTREDTTATMGIVAPERPEVVPDLRLVRVQEQPDAESRLVRFAQTKENIPVFGGHAVCELGPEQELLSASGEVGEVSDVSVIASISQADAVAALADLLGVDIADLKDVKAAELQLFPVRDDAWRLIWLFRNVPAASPEFESDPDGHGHGLGCSPRDLEPHFDYLLDAHDGSLVYSYPAAPTLIPTYGCGLNDNDDEVEFFCQDDGSGGYELRDAARKIATYDLCLKDIDDPELAGPIRTKAVDVGDAMKGAVSAHSNASIVDDFYRGVLKRNGIDNQGMELVNVVNCTYARAGEPKDVWHNAVWWNNRMWYGQAPDGKGVTRSFARYLDVIAHELTHGVTSSSAGLVYRDQSGALNESYSDIFGVIVKNWDATGFEGGDVADWDWAIGRDLGSDGKPLRDLSDPRLTGDPAEMSEYVKTDRDSGGVHTNSNIHNKAAYNVLTATEPDGSRAFTPYQAALLFYYGLGQLGKLSNFKDSLTAVVNAANSLWKGDPPVRDAKVAAIRGAFAAVGIK